MICDVGCFLGTWPLRSLPSAGLSALQTQARRNRVKCAAISAFEEVFWEDAVQATRWSVAQIAKIRWALPFQVVNPSFPGWQKDLERGVRDLGVKGIRLTPAYHRYSLRHAGVRRLADAAREYGLPVALHVRLQDERMHWIARFPPVPPKEAAQFLEKTRDLRVALLGFEFSEMAAVTEAVNGRADTWVDWSRMRAMLWGMDRLLDRFPAERILYCSLWPLQAPSSVLNQLTIARVAGDVRRQILWRSGMRFLTGA